MMMANPSPFGAGTPALTTALAPNASVPASTSGSMVSIMQGAAAPQPTNETGAVAPAAPDFAALLALNILGAMPGAALPGVASPDGGRDDGGLDIGADTSQGDALPEGAQQEPLAMALLALNGVVLPMPGLAPVLMSSPSLPSSSNANGATAAVIPTMTSAATPAATSVVTGTASNIMAALPLNIGGIAPTGSGLPNISATTGVQGMSPDLPTAGILANGTRPEGRFALADAVRPAPRSSAAPDVALALAAAPVAMPTVLATAPMVPRAKMANGPAAPDAPLPLMAGIVAPAPDMSMGKARPLTFGVQEMSTSGLSELAAPASAPSSGSALPSLQMTTGLVVASVDTDLASPDVAIADAGAAQMPVERQLDLARHDRWVNDLARDIAASASSDGKMTFRLDPPQLGRLAVTLQQGEAGLSVRLDAETAEATQIITQAQPRLMEDLRQQGVRIADASVGTQTGQNQNQSQNPQQNQGQQQGQNMAQANSGQQDQSRQQGRAFDLNGDPPAPQAEAKTTAKATGPDADAHRRVA